jgi:hypothetical protein
VVLRRQLKRRYMLAFFFQKLPPSESAFKRNNKPARVPKGGLSTKPRLTPWRGTPPASGLFA